MNKQEAELILDNLVKWKAVPLSCLKKITKELADASKCQDFLNWFRMSPLKALLDARALVPELMWEGYQLLDLRGLREQDIFYAARKDMIAAFKLRYAKTVPPITSEQAKDIEQAQILDQLDKS